jgi:predicted acyl esterase
LKVMGKIVVELTHSSNKPNVDLFVRISEVNTKGRSYGVSDTYMRLQPGGSSEVVHLESRDCAHRFAEGNRLRLIVAGASHPHNGINLERAVHTIHHGETGISRVVFPVST